MNWLHICHYGIFHNNELFTVIKEKIVCIKMLKNDFVTEGKVTNPKLLDVTLRVCQKSEKIH